MGASDRRIAALLRQIATQETVDIRHEHSVTGRVAAQVYLVEQYGFEYGEAWREGARKEILVARMYRDPRPEARAREAATIAAYPEAGTGGAAPGLRPGTLKPTDEAAEAVARIKDRIGFDVMAGAAAKGQQVFAYACVGVFVLMLLVLGHWLGALLGGAALAGFLFGAFRLGGVRRQRIAERLTAAGFTAVTDEHGRTRFLRPGQQLPGHANPFGA
ncbi:hypothetical protein [Streptomyces sp. NPDC005805]|uniref:hypothetical protein n=1 Tax=Streptomyces sp. NPDC005805 TaxID=3157068 RepID=UPI0033D2DF26